MLKADFQHQHQPLRRGRLPELPGGRQRDRAGTGLLPVSGPRPRDRPAHARWLRPDGRLDRALLHPVAGAAVSSACRRRSGCPPDGSGDIGRINRQQQVHSASWPGSRAAQPRGPDQPPNDRRGQRALQLTIDQPLSKDEILSLIDAFRTVNPMTPAISTSRPCRGPTDPNRAARTCCTSSSPKPTRCLRPAQSFSRPTPPRRPRHGERRRRWKVAGG